MSALNHIKLLKKYGIRTLDEALHFIILAEHEGLTDEECTALYKAMGIRSVDTLWRDARPLSSIALGGSGDCRSSRLLFMAGSVGG